LAYVDVAGTTGAVAVASVDAGTANQTVEALFDRFHGINGFDQNPNLNHVARLPVVRRV
jgi:hypothetical protein